MIVRKLRLQKGWSQDQLAQMSGLSIRTIQRIERGHNAGLESWKSLAAVFETDISTLKQEPIMTETIKLSETEQEAITYVRDIKGFYAHLISYVVVILGLLVINLLTNSNNLWFMWPALGWGIGIMSHAASVFEWFNFFGTDWEKRQVEKRLGRKL